jgi:hypothetical protein
VSMGHVVVDVGLGRAGEVATVGAVVNGPFARCHVSCHVHSRDELGTGGTRNLLCWVETGHFVRRGSLEDTRNKQDMYRARVGTKVLRRIQESDRNTEMSHEKF